MHAPTAQRGRVPNPLAEPGAKPGANKMAMIPFTHPGTLGDYAIEIVDAVDVYMDEHPLSRHLIAFVTFIGIVAIVVGTYFAARAHWTRDTRRVRHVRY